jgi:anti-anti-sigma factor
MEAGDYVKLHEQKESDVVILKPEGRIDASALPEFSAFLYRKIDDGAKKILIDFSGSDYMSSAGIRALLEGYKRIQQNKGDMAFCSVDENLLELFEVVSLDKVFMIYPDEFTALDKMMA